MSLDHSNANVTISISGVTLTCINRREQNRCEVGILSCDRHKLVFDIQQVEMDPASGRPIHSSLVQHSLSLVDDIVITVEHPEQKERGVSIFTRRGFDRLHDTGDDEDFKWIPDLEGPEFHNRELRLRNTHKLQPVIFITDGTLYSGPKTEELFARVSLTGKASAVALGKLGNGLRADITPPAGAAVVLRNRSDGAPLEPAASYELKLPKQDHVRYFITIENLCEASDESEGTDFRLFYEVVQDPGGKQFDLRRIVETGPHAAAEEPLEDREDVSLDGYPLICSGAYAGQTQTFTGTH